MVRPPAAVGGVWVTKHVNVPSVTGTSQVRPADPILAGGPAMARMARYGAAVTTS